MKTMLLETEDLCKYYGSGENLVKAIDHTTMDIQRGEFTAIVGRSGSGKSTLLHMLGALDRPDSGKVRIEGKNVFELKDEELAVFRRRKIGFIFQNYNLIPSLNVWENIVLPMGLDKKKVDQTFVRNLTERIGITDKLKSLPSTLSRGQQQRVACARAIVTNPSLILADEPTGALDSRSAGMFLDSLGLLNEERHATILMVTHDAFTASHCKRILFMKDGRIFNELVRGADSRRAFFDKIMQVVSLLGGDKGHAF